MPTPPLEVIIAVTYYQLNEELQSSSLVSHNKRPPKSWGKTVKTV